MGKLANTTQLEGAPPVGLASKGSGLKGSPEKETREEHVGPPAAEQDTLPETGWDPAHLARASMPRGALHACPTVEAPREDLYICFVASRKPVALPKAKFPRKKK